MLQLSKSSVTEETALPRLGWEQTVGFLLEPKSIEWMVRATLAEVPGPLFLIQMRKRTITPLNRAKHDNILIKPFSRQAQGRLQQKHGGGECWA